MTTQSRRHPIDPASRRHSVAESSAKTVEIIRRIRAIPEGFVSTYGDVDARAPRAVGRVLASTQANVPWHRVVRADGSLAMGAKQRALLRGEDVPMRGERVDLGQARFRGW